MVATQVRSAAAEPRSGTVRLTWLFAVGLSWVSVVIGVCITAAGAGDPGTATGIMAAGAGVAALGAGLATFALTRSRAALLGVGVLLSAVSPVVYLYPVTALCLVVGLTFLIGGLTGTIPREGVRGLPAP